MYQDYDEKKELRDINMEFNASYIRGDMDEEQKNRKTEKQLYRLLQ